MIYFNCTLQFPKWLNLSGTDRSWHKNVKLTKNKSWQVELEHVPDHPRVSFGLSLSFRGEDHAGLYVHLSFFYWSVDLEISDNRHWNYDDDKWEVYDD